MEAGEESSGNSLKRQRAPLSDSEDNIISPSEGNVGQKRRRLVVAGRENHSPKQSSSGHLAQLGTKPDTPIVPSVHSRVLQLTQRREGGTPPAQRCLSDPGADSPSAVIHGNGFREQLLGEGEFSQRMERFKVPVFQAGPTQSPVNPYPQTRSNFVSDIQQKLQGTPTTSSEQASRIRQEREKELSRLHFQPISENPWLKRSSSDPSLAQGYGDAEMTDGSFTETPTSGAEKLFVHTRGEGAFCDSGAPAASSSEEQLQMEWKKQNTHQEEEVKEGKDHKASVGNEEDHVGSQQSQSQTVLMLSFSEDQSFSKISFCKNQNASGDEQSLLDLTQPEESNLMETGDVFRVREQSRSEMFSLEEDEKINDSSHGEEEIEPSSDEESRLWTYPQHKVYKEENHVTAQEQEDCCEITLSSESQEVENFKPEPQVYEAEHCLDDSVKDQCPLTVEGNLKYHNRCYEGSTEEDSFTITQDQHEDDVCQYSKDIQTVNIKEDDMGIKEVETSPFSDVTQALKETQARYIDIQRNTDVAKVSAEAFDTGRHDPAQSVTEAQVSEHLLETEKMQQEEERQGAVDGLTEESNKAEGRESSKKVTFILEPELINSSSLCETNNSMETETSTSDVELSCHEETHTAEIIDQMFEEVLEYAGRMEEERVDDNTEDRDSGIVSCSRSKDKMDMESEKEKSKEEGDRKEECDESNGDELLTFPPSGILSPLSKSVEAVVTPLRLAVSQESNLPSLLLTPEETTTLPSESAPLYSIDAYRTQRQSKLPTIQSVTPAVQRRAPEKSQAQQSTNTKQKIAALNEEAGKLQTVINQTLQALSCCTDEEHGQGSLEEAEAEKLLLVSCEKRSALLTEVARLREESSSELGETAGEEKDCVSQQPCRGAVSITNIQLPLKVEFVCSSHSRTGRPSHYFFVLIRYGPCNIVATPLATAADAQNGDTISFPTSVTLKDIHSSFEIDVEVYSLSHTSSNTSSLDRTTTKSRVTPRKLLNTITRSNNSLASATLPTLNTRRSSNFCLVGCHKITLTSLGHSKFPLDKMKLEGKIRRLLGDDFQEKVPFLSPLEGNIYLQLHSRSHSNVQHQGFLTMFELISGYGVWHRRYFVLEECSLYYWNHPNDKETKGAEGSISLSSSPTQCVRPVKRDSCARPFTFELVSNIPNKQQDDGQEALSKCWFSADTKQERLDWMEKLSQALLDFHTWNQTSATQTESRQSNTSSNLRESIL